MPGPIKIAEWFQGAPNKLTLLRVLSIPFIFVLFCFDFQLTNVLGALLFLVAAITDFFDGFLARKYHLQSRTGALLDPIADKLLVLTGVIMVVRFGDIVLALIAILLLGREFVVTAMRVLASERNYHIEVSHFGKLKTGFQVGGLFGVMVKETYFDFPFKFLGMMALWIAVLLSIYSAYLYWDEFQRHLETEKS